ncbi:hypothetical protein [Bradyrhizobium sp. SZCCHNR1020]|uniref:hypothetical protein n=1 Tax=Bradyrhizobium sp. SZCCHNR1020 TaxID=3057343 RepID=UPI002915EF72|nr:hypothetical protein [Bradyrhizobium sp. SZCCHNR1020]
MAKLDLGPNDIVVLKSKSRLGARQADDIRAVWGKHFPGIKCVVLDDDMDLSVLKQHPIESARAA